MNTTTTHRPLSVADLVALAEIASAAQQSAKIRYLSPDSHDVISGTADPLLSTPHGQCSSHTTTTSATLTYG